MKKLYMVVAGASSLFAVGSVFAADGDFASAASTAVAGAQTQGTTVGVAVVACVCALCVVGLVISLVRKV